MAAIVQQGTTVQIGYNGLAYTGTVLQDATVETMGTVDTLLDTDGAALTKLISNKGVKISFTAIITNASNDAPPEIGSVVSLNFNGGGAANYMVESASVALQAKEQRISLTVVKEASMTYS